MMLLFEVVASTYVCGAIATYLLLATLADEGYPPAPFVALVWPFVVLGALLDLWRSR